MHSVFYYIAFALCSDLDCSIFRAELWRRPLHRFLLLIGTVHVGFATSCSCPYADDDQVHIGFASQMVLS